MAEMMEIKTKSIDLEDKKVRGILIQCLENVKNGSLTIIKQDGHVIQINTSEKYFLYQLQE